MTSRSAAPTTGRLPTSMGGSALLRRAVANFSVSSTATAADGDDRKATQNGRARQRPAQKTAAAAASNATNIGVARRRRAAQRSEAAKRDLTLRRKLRGQSRVDRLLASAAAEANAEAESRQRQRRLAQYRLVLRQATADLERELATSVAAAGKVRQSKTQEATQSGGDKRQQKRLLLARELDFKRFGDNLREILVSNGTPVSSAVAADF